jgi:hypothetical protein
MGVEGISVVVVMHPSVPMRRLLHTQFAKAGFSVLDAPTYAAVLRVLRGAAAPAVVVAGNRKADFHAEQRFFRQIVADATLARRHRFVLFSPLPEWLPPSLDATLRGLDVPVLRLTSLRELLDAVALAAGQWPAQGEGASAE